MSREDDRAGFARLFRRPTQEVVETAQADLAEARRREFDRLRVEHARLEEQLRSMMRAQTQPPFSISDITRATNPFWRATAPTAAGQVLSYDTLQRMWNLADPTDPRLKVEDGL